MLPGRLFRKTNAFSNKKIKHKPITKPPQIHGENYRPHQ